MKYVILFTVALLLLACQNRPKQSDKDKALPLTLDTQIETRLIDSLGAGRDSDNLTIEMKIFAIADSIINRGNENIGVLGNLDSDNIFIAEDHFTNATTKNRLALIGGSSGLSNGSFRNLLILFSNTDDFKVIWAWQFGTIDGNIIDLNGDGIKEIITESSAVWMGESHDNYEIINFKDGKLNTLFKAHSFTVFDMDDGVYIFMDYPEKYEKGDTLVNNIDCSLIEIGDKRYGVKQIQTVIIHNGGKSTNDIVDNMTTKVRESLQTLE